MKSHLRGLLQPAATSPTDPFRWSDERPVEEQVLGGFRKAGGLLLGFCVMSACLGALEILSGHESKHGARATLLAWAVLTIATVIMLWTANLWARFVTILFFGPAVPRIGALLLLGSGSFQSSDSHPQVELAEFLAYSIAVIALTWRFVGKHPAPTTVLDRLALTFFVLAVIREAVIPYQPPPWSLILGGLLLLIAWFVHRLTGGKHKKHHRREMSQVLP